MLTDLTTSFKVVRTALALWWNAWPALAAANLVWALCWLSIVLGPPATFVVYRIGHTVVHGRDVYVRELPGLLRRDFLKSWGWMLANLLILAGIWVNLQLYGRLAPDVSGWPRALLLLVGVLWLTLQFYALPYLVEQEVFSLRQALRNALLTTLASPLYSLVLLSFAAFLVAVSLRFIPLLFLGVPCLVVVLGVCAVAERLETFGVRERDAEP